MAYTIDERTVPAGDRAWIEVSVTEDADGRAVTVPVHVVHGGDGPVLWVQGCLHGPEQVGAYSIREFLDDLDPSTLRGTVLGLPVVNRTAFAAKRRESPVDGKDLNRTFPGSADGTFSDMLAHAVYTLAREHADYVVDMHTGGNEFMIPGYSIFPATGDEVERETRELCRVADLPYVVGIPPGDLDGAMYAELAAEGVPAIITETGGEGRLHDEHVRNAGRSLRNVARHVGVVPGEPTLESEPSVHDGLDIVESHTGGFFEATVSGNEHVRAGDELATITDTRGRTRETVTAPYDAVAVAVRTYAVARPGDWILELTPDAS
jgi:hypothetical protein